MESWILLVVVGLLAGILVWLIIQYGTVNIDPQHIAIRRNVITGGLKELKPGLKYFIPGVYENFQLVDCRQVILDPEPLTVTSRDGQRVDVDYQITLWVDGFFEEGKDELYKENQYNKRGKLIAKKGDIKDSFKRGDIKKGQVIKAITKIGEQIGAGLEKQISPEQTSKNLEIIGLKESNVAIQNMIGNYLVRDLIGSKKLLTISCPYCDRDISGGDPEKEPPDPPETTCPDPEVNPEKQCEMITKEKKVPSGFFERLSFSSGIKLHNDLGKRYGMGCLLKIRNVLYPADLERAARAERVAELEGSATQARFAKETVAFKNLIEEAHISPNVAYLGGKIMEAIPEIVAALKGERREKGERKEKGEKK